MSTQMLDNKTGKWVEATPETYYPSVIEKIRRKVLFWLVGEKRLEDAFSVAYEHGIEKAGYKDDAIPTWKQEVFERFANSLWWS